MTNSWIDFLIFGVAIALVAVLYFTVFRKDEDGTRRKSKDLAGPARAAKPLAAARRLCATEGYKLIAPAALARSGAYADLDFIIVGVFGVLCVKCLGLDGEVYGSAGDGKWLQVKAKGKQGEERISFENPLAQAARDSRLVRDALFSANLKSVPVETVCVFTNPHAQLALPRDTGHYTVKTFRGLLDKDKLRQDKKVDMEKVAAALEACRVPEARKAP